MLHVQLSWLSWNQNFFYYILRARIIFLMWTLLTIPIIIIICDTTTRNVRYQVNHPANNARWRTSALSNDESLNQRQYIVLWWPSSWEGKSILSEAAPQITAQRPGPPLRGRTLRAICPQIKIAHLKRNTFVRRTCRDTNSATSIRCTNVDSMLAQRLRRWPSIESTLGKSLVMAG